MATELFREPLQQRIEQVLRELERLDAHLRLPAQQRPTVTPEQAARRQELYEQHARQLQRAAEELLQLADVIDREITQARRTLSSVDRRDDPPVSRLMGIDRQVLREVAAAAATPPPRPAQPTAAPRSKYQKVPHPEPADSGPRGPRHLLTRRLVQTEYEQYYAYRTPAAFELLGRTVPVSNWRDLYLGVLQMLAEHDEATFRRLPRNPLFVTKTGQNDFSERPEVHRDPLALSHGLFVEGKRGAAQMAFRIGNLLDTFGIPRGSFDIILAPVAR